MARNRYTIRNGGANGPAIWGPDGEQVCTFNARRPMARQEMALAQDALNMFWEDPEHVAQHVEDLNDAIATLQGAERAAAVCMADSIAEGDWTKVEEHGATRKRCAQKVVDTLAKVDHLTRTMAKEVTGQ